MMFRKKKKLSFPKDENGRRKDFLNNSGGCRKDFYE